MGLYDRDYMKERNKKSFSYKSSAGIDKKIIIVAVISFILGYLAGKII